MERKSCNIIKEIRGLKFPDLYVTRFFFKEGLNKSSGRVIEFGCGNGNNLFLFYSYGYDVYGIDIDKKAIENARFNFKNLLAQEGIDYLFIEDNILNLKEHRKTVLSGKSFNVLLLPNIVSYIRKNQFKELMQEIKLFLDEKGKFFIRFRSPRDMRIGMGKKIGNGEYIITSEITGESNAILSVYEESEMLFILKSFLGLKNYEIFHLYEENYHTDRKVLNADIVIWGSYEL